MKMMMKLAAILASSGTLGAPLAVADAHPTAREDALYAEYLQASGKDVSRYFVRSISDVAPAAVEEREEPSTVRLNRSFVASSDRLEGCQNAVRRDWRGYGSRFCKIKPSLLPIYEKVSQETDVPVAILYAVGEYETHNAASDISDGGRSCGLHGWNTWRTWGFASLAECHDPEASIRKLAESYMKNGGADDTYLWLRKHNGGAKRGPTLPVTAVYAERVLDAAARYYSSN